MVKFLSGSQYSGDAVPLCAYWRNDVRTDPDEEISPLESTGETFAQQGQGQASAIGSFEGQCVANAFYPKSSISCFNDGECNGEGKCIVCSRYHYGGMRMAITHSPPFEVLRYFEKGLTEEEIKSPNLVRFPPSAAQHSEQDQAPYHILARNIQAEVAKCCHWNAGDGVPGKFFLATVRDGPTVADVTDADGNVQRVAGLKITNSEFPDEVGTFFPTGTVVVAGFEDQPSFYLEPRTGLVKPGDDVIFNFTSGQGVSETASTIRTKQLASNANDVVTAAVNASILAWQATEGILERDKGFYTSALATKDSATITSALAKYNEATTNASTAQSYSASAQTLGQEAIDLIAATINSQDRDSVEENGQDLATKLGELADAVEGAGSAAGETSAADQTAVQVQRLRILIRSLTFSASGGTSKCEFFFESSNAAEKWNSPTDGSLPCNGVRTDCPYYTGDPWQYATDEKMEAGRPILAEQVQELRFRSDDWTRFTDPEEEFKSRFTTPFIWAFKDYVTVGATPDLEDMALYKPRVLYSMDDQRNAISSSVSPDFETIRLNKVSVRDFETFALAKHTALTQPGSEVLDKDQPPQFPSLIAEPSVPSATLLQVTYPQRDEVFTYRIWSPDKNKISLFGKASPDQTIYIINDTALRNRDRYHSKFGTKNFFDVPTAVPYAPGFTGLTATELLAMVSILRNEKAANQADAPLGFDEVTSSRDGFWSSIQEVDLVHNRRNKIYMFLVASETNVLTDEVTVDCNWLHAIPTQTSFAGTDFTINDTSGYSKLGTNAGNTVAEGTIQASTAQLVGKNQESVGFGYGYHAWRFKDRGLRYGTLNADNDLQGQNQVADQASTLLVTTASPSEFVVNVSYHVVQYRKKDVVLSSADWDLLDDCGRIMARIPDVALHRVLPLPNQAGNFKALPNILINGGGAGSEIAQWGLEAASVTTPTGDKTLVQFYRDPDGFGMPANHVILGPPAITPEDETPIGRLDPTRDTLTLTYTFLRAQTGQRQGDEGASSRNGEADPAIEGESVEVVTNNFYADNVRTHDFAFTFDDSGTLTAGGNTTDAIATDQQDYVYVFTDSEGRPIGKKYTRFYVMYYNFTCINVEIFYRWAADCTTYALIPDLYTNVGTAGGRLGVQPDATNDPNDTRLSLRHRISSLLGDRDCSRTPNCGDHSFIRFGPLRREFEVIVETQERDADGELVLGEDGQPNTILKANFPSAGGSIEGTIVSSERPGSQFLKKYGPMWYPYTACERPRYQFNTYGPLRTDSTELINTELVAPGLVSGATVIVDDSGKGTQTDSDQTGVFGKLPDQSVEAYHGPDRVVPKILDIHPSLRPCTSGYTYGNQILKAGANRFAGYARRRGVIDTFLYAGFAWADPPFGNFGRPRLVFEMSNERGDYLGGSTGNQIGYRWMPMFPKRENLGGTIELFDEGDTGEPEPQALRLSAQSSPAGTISESVQEIQQDEGFIFLGVNRFTHKALVVNKVGAAIEFPFSPYFPMFLPDGDIGKEPSGDRVPVEEGSKIGEITTMWAWRETEKPILRGVVGDNILTGVQLDVPDYFIDNRRLEVRMRPPEGNYFVVWESPTYDEEGKLTKNATIRLGPDGPRREVVVDFVNRQFGLALQDNTVYDTYRGLGDDPFPCEEDTPTDNLQLASKCSCIGDVTDPSLEAAGGSPAKLPARFLHLDELAPDGFFALYQNTELQTPFAVDIGRERNTQPCCMCLYHIPGIFAKIDPSFLPATNDTNPAWDGRLGFQYTWSRVPHGLPESTDLSTAFAKDGNFNGFEQQSDDLLDHSVGEVFTNYFTDTKRSFTLGSDGGAAFPSVAFAANAKQQDSGIFVGAPLPVGQVKFGGTPVDGDSESQGESEQIVLTMIFPTYVRINQVTIDYYTGVGMEAPKAQVAVVPPANRVNAKPTLNSGVVVGEALLGALERDIPDPTNRLNASDIAAGRARFTSIITTSLSDLPFWEQYGQEWQIIFPPRGNAQSMIIGGIQLSVDALVDGQNTTEVIQVRERKYYKSEGAVPGGLNPERFLDEVDSATVYWRTASQGSPKGANRHRAYAWGNEIKDNQDPIRSSDISYLESLQKQEYDAARSLFESPYRFTFTSFIPLDEQDWIEVSSEGIPSWTLTCTSRISEVSEVANRSTGTLIYGTIPERSPFNAPGHVWVHKLTAGDIIYGPCCDDCPDEKIVDYEYLHLHDNLAIVETASFWSELPSGLTRLIRSTMLLPDPTLQGGAGGVGDVVLLDESNFTDSQGNPVPTEVLEAAGFKKDPTTGEIYIDQSTPGT